MQVRPAGTGGHPDADTCDERGDAAGVGDGADAPDPTTSTSLHAGHELAPASWIRRHRGTIAAHVVTALVTAFVIRVVGSGFGAGYPPVFPDSFSFTDVARRGPFTGRFWFDERPIGFPLLFWAVGRSVRFVVLAQIALYVTAFGAVVAVALRTLRSRAARLFVTVLTVAIALQPRFVLWTTHVLSESLAITTGVAALAAWWWFAAAPTRPRAIVALVVTGAFVVARDSNVVVVALSVLPVLAVVGWRRRRADPAVARTLVAGAVLGVVLCGYVTVSQDVSDRNIYPVLNNVGERILPDVDMTAWFEGHGMPLDDTLRGATGDNAFDDGSAMLQDPAFAELREWASGPGQRAQLWSYVRHAPFWSDLLGGRLDELLGYDYEDYDAFAVGERLWSPVLDGPRSSAQLLVWVAAAGVALTLAASRPRLRPRVVVVAVALAGGALDVYLSFAGDSLEVQRHLVAALARSSVALVLAVGLGIEWFSDRRRADPAAASAAAAPTVRSRAVTAVALGTTALATSIVLAAFFGNELRAQDYDPQFMKVLVDRVGALGVGYYEAALHNKGPFEPFVYRVAAGLTSDDGFWFAISAFVLVAAALSAGAVVATARAAGASRWLAAAVAAGLFVHLTISRADYAGVLYSRNMTTAMLAVAWSLALWSWPWNGSARRRLLALAVIGVLLGLCVQTLVTAVFAVAVVAGLVLDRVRRDTRGDLRRAALVLGAAAAVTVAAPAAWYAARGTFAEFWGGWWIYGSYQSSGLGRSLFAQFGLAWDQAFAYYRRWPLSAAVLVGAAGLAVVRWPQLDGRQRALRLGVAGWLLAAWIELALAQRYSTHYFAVLAVPTWIAAATLVADVAALAPPRRVRPAWRVALPGLVALAVMFASTEDDYRRGLAVASGFTGVDDLALARRQQETGPVRTVRATIDVVSRPGDALLAWTERPWTYLQWDRIAATRYVWGSFLLGQIYLGRAGPEFVPPHTAEWFADDLARTDPAVFVEEVDHPVPADSLVGEIVAARFTPIYSGPTQRIYVRDDLAAELRQPANAGEPWEAASGAAEGWLVDGNRVSSTAAPTNGVAADQPLLAGTCQRLDGTLAGLAGAETRFVVDDATAPAAPGHERQYLAVDGSSGWSATDTVELERALWERPAGPVPFSLLVGVDSVVLVVDGEVRAAVRTWGAVDVAIRAPATVTDLTRSPLRLGEACPG